MADPSMLYHQHHQLRLLQVMVSSVAQTQQSQDFLASQAATQKLQEQLTQTQQSCEAAAADERALDQAHRHVVLGCHLACMPVHCLLVVGSPLLLMQADLAAVLTAVALTCREAMGELNLAVSKVDTVLRPIVERLGGEVRRC